MSVPKRKWILSRTEHALQMLACPADVQIRLMPRFVCVTDELALDFDHWQSVLVSNFGSELSPDQIASLAVIDDKFASFSRGGKEFKAEFWTDEALRQSADWQSIRQMAGRTLHLFGWPLAIPPSYAHEYVKGTPNVESDS